MLYARQWLDPSDADDAVQEALLALVVQRRRPHNPGAWLYRAVRNAAFDHARSAARRRRREQAVAATRREWFEANPAAALDAELLEQSLAGLSPEHRELVVLRIWGGLSFAEIAAVVELSVSTVHDRYNAALRRLRTAMEKPALEKPCQRHTK